MADPVGYLLVPHAPDHQLGMGVVVLDQQEV
jgi:hypothetical protein